ncbi:MAG: class C beta-lactamase-related serine hydrolase [Candidatus Omnitrophota bacterium]|jgi:CubicO group peptidase (beta-lactamase class C family)|nr:MAG: class C beta-lactamase-related serine hydrolase [Candidatus Omnitrophota bacterium]
MARPRFVRVTICVLTLFLTSVSFAYCGESANPFVWHSSVPEELGISSEKFDAMLDRLKERSTAGILVVRHDRVVGEWYSSKLGPDIKHYTASLAKALVGGMSLLLVLNDELMQIDDPAECYVAEWGDDPTRKGITIRHLATHSSGIEDAEVAGMGHFESGGWKSRFWNKNPDPFTISRDWAPMKFKPGTGFEYSNPGMAMLAYAVTAALQNSPHKDIRTLLRERIMRPIGVPDEEWNIGYGQTYEVNGRGMVANWGGGNYSARAVARVGRLMLRKGNWEGEQLIDSKWVEKVTADAETPDPFRGPGEGPCPRAGLAWWVNSDGNLSKVPRDAFMGAGAGNQVLLVIPSLDLMAVRFGGLMKEESFWGGLEEFLFNPLMDAIVK